MRARTTRLATSAGTTRSRFAPGSANARAGPTAFRPTTSGAARSESGIWRTRRPNPRARTAGYPASIRGASHGPHHAAAGNFQGEEWRGNAAAFRELRHEYRHYYPDRTVAEIEQIDDQLPCIPGFNDGYLFTSPVGTFTPNAHGFYDLGGNVNEWCQDRFASSDRRILRGGSFGKLRPDQLLSSRRYRGDPTRRMASHGFRIAVDP